MGLRGESLRRGNVSFVLRMKLVTFRKPQCIGKEKVPSKKFWDSFSVIEVRGGESGAAPNHSE